jgi:hypothetical protein
MAFSAVATVSSNGSVANAVLKLFDSIAALLK